MNILLVEDDDIKASSIIEFINLELAGKHEIIRKKSWQSGLLEIINNNNYELILLDMSMPRYDPEIGDVNEEFETYAGWEFLREMKRRKLNIKTCIITAFDVFGKDDNMMDSDKLNKILCDEFKELYKGMIHYNSHIITWKEDLSELLTTKGE